MNDTTISDVASEQIPDGIMKQEKTLCALYRFKSTPAKERKPRLALMRLFVARLSFSTILLR